MHLTCLGVMKKLLLAWTKGPHRTRIGLKNVNRISDRLITIKNFIPKEFGRKPRTLNDLPRYKATELRQFLLYTGPVVLKGIIPEDLFNHFLTLHLAVRLLCSVSLVKLHTENARNLLRNFVSNCQILYGQSFMSYNVHNLIHLSDDAAKFGALDNFSAFPFENQLLKLKKMVTKHDRPLAQLVRRIGESSLAIGREPLEFKMNFGKEHRNGPTFHTINLPFRQFTFIKGSHGTLSTSFPDNCFFSSDSEIVVCRNIIQQNGFVYIIGEIFQEKKDLYQHPWPSSLFGVFEVSSYSDMKMWPLSKFRNKAVIMPLCYSTKTESYAVFALLHHQFQ